MRELYEPGLRTGQVVTDGPRIDDVHMCHAGINGSDGQGDGALFPYASRHGGLGNGRAGRQRTVWVRGQSLLLHAANCERAMFPRWQDGG